MTGEIPRLMEGELSELERMLLKSAGVDEPSPDSVAKAADVLGVASALRAAKWLGLAKWSATVGVVGALGLMGFRALETETPRVDERLPVPPAEVVSTDALGAATSRDAKTIDEAPLRSASNAPARAKPAASASIADEITAMQAARAALAAGQSRKALDLVGDYRKRFARPAFGEEATVIRILALAGSGQKAQATREARAFLARHPKSPHSPRLRALVEP